MLSNLQGSLVSSSNAYQVGFSMARKTKKSVRKAIFVCINGSGDSITTLSTYRYEPKQSGKNFSFYLVMTPLEEK